VVRNLWYRNRVIEAKDIPLFDMPLLETGDTDMEGRSFGQEAERAERDAYEIGFEAGEKAGLAMGEQKAMVLIERIEALIRELTALRAAIIKELEPQVVELAVAIARKIILRELTINPDEIVEMTKEAMMRLDRTGPISIRINPSLHDLFMRHKPELLNIHPDVVFEVDPSAPLHGAVVMGDAGDVITDVDEQLRNLIREMGERLGSD